MVLVPQPKRVKVRNLLAFLEDQIHAANADLRDEDDPDVIGRLDDTYIAGRDASAKQHLGDIAKALGWLANDLSITFPAAWLDADIDALNRDIREFDDNT